MPSTSPARFRAGLGGVLLAATAVLAQVPGAPAFDPGAPDTERAPTRARPSAGEGETGVARVSNREPVELRPVFRPGRTYRYVRRMEIRARLPGLGTRTADIEQQIRLRASPRPEGAEGIALHARSERLEVNLRSGERQLTYDSLQAKDRDSALGRHLRASLTGWVKLELDGDLEVVSARTGGSSAGESPFPELPQFGPEGLRRFVSLLPQAFPEEPVAPGDRWTIEGEREMGEGTELRFGIDCVYTGDVDHEGRNCARIELSGEFSGETAVPVTGTEIEGESESESERKSEGGMDSFAKGKATFQATRLGGRILFDRVEQVVRHGEQRLNLRMEVPRSSDEASPVRVLVQQRTTWRLLHVVPTDEG